MIVTGEILEALASFVGGTMFGYILRLIVERAGNKERVSNALDHKALEEVVAFVIVCVWTISMLISTFYPDRHTPIELHLLMGGVFGVLLNGGRNPILDSILKRVTTTTEKVDVTQQTTSKQVDTVKQGESSNDGNNK